MVLTFYDGEKRIMRRSEIRNPRRA